MANHYDDSSFDSDDTSNLREEKNAKRSTSQYDADMRRKIEKKLELRRLRKENRSYDN